MVRKIRRTTSSKSRSTGNPTTVRKDLGSKKDKKSQVEEDEVVCQA
jgi:hypothetical protein